ncbi:MAG: response regulator [Bryobacteraceae bacterium]|nr:response regulator [Bryobacteraceae bacterium]MDW8380148.1 response regulator [Bryobacterales bacterium]
MADLLVVEDDRQQMEVRRLILQQAGHRVECATSAREAKDYLCQHQPDLLLMDLRLPRTEDGLELIRHSRQHAPHTRIVVLSGWTAEFERQPEHALVDRVVAKPVRSERLLSILSQLAAFLLLVSVLGAQTYPFQLDAAAEVTAEVEMSAPGGDWGRSGREAALATLTLDEEKRFHVMAFAGSSKYIYRVWLGALQPGPHQLKIERHPDYSARGVGLQVFGVTYRQYKPQDPDYAVIANAPAIFARPNTIGKFTDIPLLMYCERLGDGSLRYSVIFSNEDGGTSTRGLMARWGRATDIEHVYQVWPGQQALPWRAIIQARGHRDVPFQGKLDAQHPLLVVATDNNMVDFTSSSAVRYQLAPLIVDLSHTSREQVMDDHPITYQIAARELEREGKLRKFGFFEGEKISHPENYLHVELRVLNKQTRLAVFVRLEGENLWRSSNLGLPELAIERSGWVRTAVELPPATQPAQVAELAFQCLPERNFDSNAACRVETVSKLFFLEASGHPGSNFWRPRLDRPPWVIAPGAMRTVSLR